MTSEFLATEFILFLLIGLGILVFEAHRQFNHPAYTKTSDDETTGNARSDYIFSLSPSEIRNRSAFFSAELVYILAIVAIYLLLIFNDAVNNVLAYLIDFSAQGDAPGGGLPEAPAIGADGATLAVEPGAGETAIDRAATPFVVSMMMVTALRFPLVRRLEVLLRSSAQRLFGIPWIPHRLRQKIEDAPVNLDALEEDTAHESDGVTYGAKIAGYRGHALASGMSDRRLAAFLARLGKLAAYQIWVNEARVWPSQEFRSDFSFFHQLNDPLSDQIIALFKDCDLLASSAEVGAGEAGEERRRMQQELWELKEKQARELSQKMAAMMALYDQNSKWPRDDAPGATQLRTFLGAVRAQDETRTFQVNVAILLLLISAGVSFVAGYVHANWLASIAESFGIEAGGQVNAFRTARDFMLSSLIVYGLSMWAALDIRRRMQRHGRWSNPFEGRRIPPMGQFLLFAVAIGFLVFAANLAYLLTVSSGWSWVGPRDAPWWTNVERQANLSLFYGLIGGVHGLGVVLMMDLGARGAANRSWGLVAGSYIAVMMALGFFLGQYLTSLSSAGGELREAIRQMRAMLYTVDLGLIALFTSVAMISFLRPPRPGKAPEAAAVQDRVA